MAKETVLIIDIKGACEHFEKKTGERMTMYKLSKGTKINDTTLSNWASGKQIKSFETLKKISDFTGYPIDKLIKKVKK